MATPNLTERTPADRMSEASSDVFMVTVYLDGIHALLVAQKRSKGARAALAIVVNAAGAISRASEILDSASMGNVLKPEAAKALAMLDEAAGALAVIAATIREADEYGVQPENPAFPTSDPLDSAARLAECCREEIGRVKRRAAAAIRALPEPYKVAA